MHRSNGAKRPFRVRNTRNAEQRGRGKEEEESENFVKIPPSFASFGRRFPPLERKAVEEEADPFLLVCCLSFAVMKYICNNLPCRGNRFEQILFYSLRWMQHVSPPPLGAKKAHALMFFRHRSPKAEWGLRQNRPCVVKFLI